MDGKNCFRSDSFSLTASLVRLPVLNTMIPYNTQWKSEIGMHDINSSSNMMCHRQRWSSTARMSGLFIPKAPWQRACTEVDLGNTIGVPSFDSLYSILYLDRHWCVVGIVCLISDVFDACVFQAASRRV